MSQKFKLTPLCMLVVLSCTLNLYAGGAKAEQLLGFSSEQAIPDSIFEQPEPAKPWMKREPVKKATPRPVTRQNLQQENRLRALEKALEEQKRIVTTLQGEQAKQQQENATLNVQLEQAQKLKATVEQQLSEREKNLASLNADLAALQQSKGDASLLMVAMDSLKADLETSKTQQANAEKQLADLRLQQAAQLLHADTLQSELTTLKQRQLPEGLKPENHQQKLAYANGVAFANNIVQSLQEQRNLGIEADRSMVLAGINDALARKTALNADEVKGLIDELDTTLNGKLLAQQEKDAVLREKQANEGKKYFAEAKKVKGTKQLAGALYKVVKAGKGSKLKPDDTVDFLITGRLPDGTVFDSSGKDNKAQQAKLNSLLPAITEVLSQLTAGSEVEITLPPEVGFGEQGVPGLIPGNATLIFDIKVNKVL